MLLESCREEGLGFTDQISRGIDDYGFPWLCHRWVSVGETEEEMLEQVKWGTSVLPQEKPCYVMGVGTPPQLLHMVGMGGRYV